MLDFMKIIVKQEGQVGFTAAEINDMKLFKMPFFDGVVDDLNKAVDLPVLVVHGLHDLSFFSENTHIN